MNALRQSTAPSRNSATRALRRAFVLLARRFRTADRSMLWTLGVLSTVIAIAAITWSSVIPFTALVLPLLLGTLLLGPHHLPWFVVYTLLLLSVVVANEQEINTRQVVGIAVLFAVGLIILLSSFRRSRLGVSGLRGESMLFDLRDRISRQGRIPDLPQQWHVEAEMRSAGSSSFAGDFIVASKARNDRSLAVAVVDVSGKGEEAGTRALLLSGAFSSLMGALPPERFLPAANDYLLRQDWAEGFATAIHLSLDLVSGRFELRSAGHPPGVHFVAGSGRWLVHVTEGPVLGLMDDAEFTCVRGTIERGDALMLFTDGLVETPQRDTSRGIDKLVGQGERLLLGGFEGGAQRLIDQLASRNDDRALLLVHRR